MVARVIILIMVTRAVTVIKNYAHNVRTGISNLRNTNNSSNTNNLKHTNNRIPMALVLQLVLVIRFVWWVLFLFAGFGLQGSKDAMKEAGSKERSKEARSAAKHPHERFQWFANGGSAPPTPWSCLT